MLSLARGAGRPQGGGHLAALGRTVLAAAGGLLTLAGILSHLWISGGFQAALGAEGIGLEHEVPLAARVLYGLGIVAGAWHILPKAWIAARHLRMNLLIILAVCGAVGVIVLKGGRDIQGRHARIGETLEIR